MASTSFVHQAAIVATTDFGQRLRDRSALITAVIAPLALAVVFGTLFGGTSDSEFVIGVADDSNSPIGAAIAQGLTDPFDDSSSGDDGDGDDAQVRFVAVESDLVVDAVSDGDVNAAIRFDEPDATDGQGAAVGLTVIDHAERPFSGDVAASVAANIGARLLRADLAVAGASATGLDPSVAQAAAEVEPYTLVETSLDGSTVDAMAFFGASMAMVLLFFTTGFAAQSILADRRTSVLDRMLAVGLRPSALLAGKVLSVSALAIVGFVVVWATTAIGFGARWGDPVVVSVLIVATVAALAGVATFVASFATNERQSQTLTSIVTFSFALLGGNFTGPANVPAALDRISAWIPNGVALRAFTEASADAADLSSLADSVGRLLAFAVVFGSIGLARIRRTIIR